MAKVKFDYDLIVIGSGAAGSVAAEIAARSGRRVAIIEQADFGGSALTRSDIPLQAMLTAAHALDEARRSASFGLRSNAIGYNYPTINNWKHLATRRSGAMELIEFWKKQGIDVFRGRAHFLSSNEISIARRRLTSDKFLIATGSKAITPNIPGIEAIDYLTMETALNLLRPPKTLFIVGADVVGVQMAELFSIFGTKVYLADTKKRILSSEDDEISELTGKVFERVRGVSVLTSSRVIAVKNESLAVKVNYLSGQTEHSVKVEKVLIATGQSPEVDLGLESANIEYDANGIKTDNCLTTSAQNIYAAGDVLGHHMNAQSAMYEGKLAVSNMFGKNKEQLNYESIPRVIWTNPEIAAVGATEADLVRADIHFKRSVQTNQIMARANVSNFAIGFAKLLTDTKGRMLGASVVAPHAAEIIGSAGVAIANGLTAAEFANATQPFGSWSESLRLAAAKVK